MVPKFALSFLSYTSTTLRDKLSIVHASNSYGQSIVSLQHACTCCAVCSMHSGSHDRDTRMLPSLSIITVFVNCPNGECSTLGSLRHSSWGFPLTNNLDTFELSLSYYCHPLMLLMIYAFQKLRVYPYVPIPWKIMLRAAIDLAKRLHIIRINLYTNWPKY